MSGAPSREPEFSICKFFCSGNCNFWPIIALRFLSVCRYWVVKLKFDKLVFFSLLNTDSFRIFFHKIPSSGTAAGCPQVGRYSATCLGSICLSVKSHTETAAGLPQICRRSGPVLGAFCISVLGGNRWIGFCKNRFFFTTPVPATRMPPVPMTGTAAETPQDLNATWDVSW